MRLLPEHNRNFSPVMRPGVFMLTLRGEVVFISTSKHTLRSVIKYQDRDFYPFDGYAVIPTDDEDEAKWMADEFIQFYKPAYNNRSPAI
jgi:hypothetical protein